MDPKLRRVVWSESEGLPGVIIDRYGDHLVLQTLTLAMDMRKDSIVEAIEDVFCRASASLAGAERLAGGAPALQVLTIIERNDAPVRKAEGLELNKGVLRGTASQIAIEIEGVKLELDLLHGQKTGFYLDQRHNYGIVAGYARNRRVLDCFTNQGAFALACAKAGATQVAGVEVGTESIARARRNAERNGLDIEWIEQDVFAFFRAAEKNGAEYDFIILDPPSFTKTKGGLRDALRGYR